MFLMLFYKYTKLVFTNIFIVNTNFVQGALFILARHIGPAYFMGSVVIYYYLII